MAEQVWRNWARNQSCTPAAIEDPRSQLEVVEAVRRARDAGQTVKVVGSGHSFTATACTEGRLLSIDALTLCVVVAVMTVAFGAGSPFLSWIQRDSLNRQVALSDYTAGLDRALGAARLMTELRHSHIKGLSFD